MQARWRAASEVHPFRANPLRGAVEYESAAVGSRLARWPRWRRLYCTSLLALAAEHLKSGVAVSSLCLVKLSAGLARGYSGL